MSESDAPPANPIAWTIFVTKDGTIFKTVMAQTAYAAFMEANLPKAAFSDISCVKGEYEPHLVRYYDTGTNDCTDVWQCTDTQGRERAAHVLGANIDNILDEEQWQQYLQQKSSEDSASESQTPSQTTPGSDPSQSDSNQSDSQEQSRDPTHPSSTAPSQPQSENPSGGKDPSTTKIQQGDTIVWVTKRGVGVEHNGVMLFLDNDSRLELIQGEIKFVGSRDQV